MLKNRIGTKKKTEFSILPPQIGWIKEKSRFTKKRKTETDKKTEEKVEMKTKLMFKEK